MNYLLSRLPMDEKGVAKTRKTVCLFFRELLVAIIVAAAIILLNKFLQWEFKSTKMYIVYGVGGGIWLILFLQNFTKYISTAMLVTTHKFMYKEDLVTINVLDTQLSNIDAVEVEYKTPLQRLFNYGHITISTRNTKHTFKNISKPDIFSARLNKQAALAADSRIRRVHVSFGLASNMKAPVRKAPNAKAKAPVKKVS